MHIVKKRNNKVEQGQLEEYDHQLIILRNFVIPLASKSIFTLFFDSISASACTSNFVCVTP